MSDSENRIATNMKITALLTGRGGNTLPDKNVLPVLGRPLCAYPALAAKKAGVFDEYYVSSDCNKILAAGAEVGFQQIIRPKHLATATAQHVDVIKHALSVMSINGTRPSILVVLMANSGTVKSEWIYEAVKRLKSKPTLSTVVPVFNDQDHHPFRAKKLDADGLLQPFLDLSEINISTNRQDLEPCYYLCHNFWAMNVANSIDAKGGQKPWAFLGKNVEPIIVDNCFDVHTMADVERTEQWLIRNCLGS